MAVTPRGLSIQAAYRDFADGKFLVNRQYQRKLVWTRDEKRKLIDSILKGYPIPLILLATETTSDGSRTFEILDGMQRLNAIFEFIENQFDLDGRYFNLQELSRANQRFEEGHFERPSDKIELLSGEQCSNFVDYTLAVTEFPSTDQEAVNDVFGRINAYGRRLSNQEQRQAGVLSGFSDLVRSISAEMRGDVSRDTLDLSEMPSISIDPDESYDSYGIRADETFWCEQGILRRNQLRESEDEQLVADIVISIMKDEPFAFSGSNLDEYYDPTSEQAIELERLINRIGPEALKISLLSTLTILLDVFRAAGPSQNAMKRILNPDAAGNPIKGPFYAVFIAFYELCVENEKSPNDHDSIVRSLTGLQSKLNVARGQVTAAARRQNIDITKGLIERHFDERDPPSVSTGAGLGIRLTNSLRRSKIETSAFETKQGIVDLSADRNENTNVLLDVIQTICGIANIGPDSDGAIFIGVADSDNDAERIKQLDGINPIKVGSRHIVGVDRETAVLGISLDTYFQKVSQAITNSGLNDSLKTSVLSKLDIIDYRDLSVITIWVPPQSSMSTLNDEAYVRNGSSTVQVSGVSSIRAVESLFNS